MLLKFQNGLSDARNKSADSWPAGQTGLATMYSLNSTDWPSGPLIDLIQRKKAGMKMGAKPNMPKVKIKNIYELQNLDSIEDSDPRDLRILKYNLCDQCEERSKKCSKCKSDAKQCTIAEQQEYVMIQKSVEPIVIDSQRFLRCNYPVMGNAPELYHQDLSNRYQHLLRASHCFGSCIN